MKIKQIKVEDYGPLKNICWEPPNLAVIYDDNMVGKTSVVDILIQFLFIPRKGSKIFADYSRFKECEPFVEIKIQNGNEIYTSGTKQPRFNLKEIFDWEEEELFRLLCIRAGDNQLVSSDEKRVNMLNGIASLISGVSTERIKKIDKDIMNECQITSTNRWKESKDDDPPWLKKHIYEELVPFQTKIDEIEEALQRIGDEMSIRQILTSDRQKRVKELEKTKTYLDILRAERIRRIKRKLQRDLKSMREYSRIQQRDREDWEKAKEVKKEATRALEGESALEEEGLRTKLKKTEAKVVDSKERLEKGLDKDMSDVNEKLRTLKKEKRTIEEKASEAKEIARDFIKEEIKKPLQNRTEKKLHLKNLSHWRDNEKLYYLISLIPILLSLLYGIYVHKLWIIFIGFFMAFFSVSVIWRKNFIYKKINSKVRSIDKKIQRNFNQQFDSILGKYIEELQSIKDICEQLPQEVEENKKNSLELSKVRKEITKWENRKSDLESERDQLPNRIANLEAKNEQIKKKVKKQEKLLRESKKNLQELREKSGVPDLKIFKEKLHKKRKLQKAIDQQKVLLNHELDTDFVNLDELFIEVESTISELRNGIDKDIIETFRQKFENKGIEETKVILSKNKTNLEKKIRTLGQKLDNYEKSIKKIKSRLRDKYGIDPEKPQDLFSKKSKYQKDLEKFIMDRIAGAQARKILNRISGTYLEDLKPFFEGDKNITRSVSAIFSEVMGSRFDVSFNYGSKEFIINEGDLEYSEKDLSSGGKKHLFYATRLTLIDEISPKPAFLILDDPFLYYHRNRKVKAINQLKYLVKKGWQILCFTVDRETKDSMVQDLEAQELDLDDLKA